jgi:hypothetical protein
MSKRRGVFPRKRRLNFIEGGLQINRRFFRKEVERREEDAPAMRGMQSSICTLPLPLPCSTKVSWSAARARTCGLAEGDLSFLSSRRFPLFGKFYRVVWRAFLTAADPPAPKRKSIPKKAKGRPSGAILSLTFPPLGRWARSRFCQALSSTRSDSSAFHPFTGNLLCYPQISNRCSIPRKEPVIPR